MTIEQAIIENLRKLPIEKQQEVLTLTETLTKTNVSTTLDVSPERSLRANSLPSPDPNLTPKERAEKWRKVIAKLPQESANLPDEALHRDTMYD